MLGEDTNFHSGSDLPWLATTEEEERFIKYSNWLAKSKYTPDMPALNLRNWHTVAVYGTLKKGNALHGMLRNAKFISGGWTESDRFVLYDIKTGTEKFPVAMSTATQLGRRVAVEVYQVKPEVIKNLDVIEENGYLYKRIRTKILQQNGLTEYAWFYIGLHSTFDKIISNYSNEGIYLSKKFESKKHKWEYYTFVDAPIRKKKNEM